MEMSFEAALAELETIVEYLERGKLSLDESLLLFEKGIKLVKKCNTDLENARLKVEKLIEENNGFISEPFEQQGESTQG